MGSTILVREDDLVTDLGYVLVCSGYLVENGRVMLVHHEKFDKWVPPGGHLSAGETFAEAAVRECLEETGLRTEAISAQPVIHPADQNARPTPVPFYVDIEREGFAVPAIVQFFYLRRLDRNAQLVAQVDEVKEIRWFTPEEVAGLKTFEQVRSLASFAIAHHPDQG